MFSNEAFLGRSYIRGFGPRLVSQFGLPHTTVVRTEVLCEPSKHTKMLITVAKCCCIHILIYDRISERTPGRKPLPH